MQAFSKRHQAEKPSLKSPAKYALRRIQAYAGNSEFAKKKLGTPDKTVTEFRNFCEVSYQNALASTSKWSALWSNKSPETNTYIPPSRDNIIGNEAIMATGPIYAGWTVTSTPVVYYNYCPYPRNETTPCFGACTYTAEYLYDSTLAIKQTGKVHFAILYTMDPDYKLTELEVYTAEYPQTAQVIDSLTEIGLVYNDALLSGNYDNQSAWNGLWSKHQPEENSFLPPFHYPAFMGQAAISAASHGIVTGWFPYVNSFPFISANATVAVVAINVRDTASPNGIIEFLDHQFYVDCGEPCNRA